MTRHQVQFFSSKDLKALLFINGMLNPYEPPKISSFESNESHNVVPQYIVGTVLLWIAFPLTMVYLHFRHGHDLSQRSHLENRIIEMVSVVQFPVGWVAVLTMYLRQRS